MGQAEAMSKRKNYVFLIENDKTLGTVVKNLLTEENFVVADAETCDAAVQLIPAFNPNLVIFDTLILATDKEGYLKVNQQVVKMKIPLLMLVDPNGSNLTRAILLNHVGINKPFAAHELLIVVQQALAGKLQ